jgi:regulator of replication initiation timing
MNTELVAKLEVVEKERDQFERDLNECSHTILVLKERLELLWKEKQQLSLELDSAREDLLHSCKSPTVAPSLSLCVRSRDIFSLQPFEGEGNTSVWKQELDRTNQELSKFYREKRKLLETIHQRDLKVEQLENSYRVS